MRLLSLYKPPPPKKTATNGVFPETQSIQGNPTFLRSFNRREASRSPRKIQTKAAYLVHKTISVQGKVDGPSIF